MHDSARVSARIRHTPTRSRRGLAAVLGVLLAAVPLLGAALPDTEDDAGTSTVPLIEIHPMIEAPTEPEVPASADSVESSSTAAVVDPSSEGTWFAVASLDPSRADLADAQIVQIHLADRAGQPVSVDPSSVRVMPPTPDLLVHPATTSGQPGRYDVEITSGIPGSFPISVAIDAEGGPVAVPVRDVGHVVFTAVDDWNWTMSSAETIGWTVPLGTDHTVVVRLRDRENRHLPGLGDRIRITAIDDATGMSWSGFAEEWLDGEIVYVAQISSQRAGQSRITVAFDDVEMQNTPIPVWWHDTVDLRTSHAETIGWTQKLGTEHTVIVRLRDGRHQPVHGLGHSLAIEFLDDRTGLGWDGTFTEQVIDDELVYVAALSSERIGQSIVTVTYKGGAVAGTPIPVWWHKGSASATTSDLLVSKDRAQADGRDAVDIEVRLHDEDGLPVTDAADVRILTTFGEISEPLTLRSGGRFAATLTSDAAGTASVSFTVDGVPGAQSAQVVFVADDEATAVAPAPGEDTGTGHALLALTGGQLPVWTATAAVLLSAGAVLVAAARMRRARAE